MIACFTKWAKWGPSLENLISKCMFSVIQTLYENLYCFHFPFQLFNQWQYSMRRMTNENRKVCCCSHGEETAQEFVASEITPCIFSSPWLICTNTQVLFQSICLLLILTAPCCMMMIWEHSRKLKSSKFIHVELTVFPVSWLTLDWSYCAFFFFKYLVNVH